MNDKLYAESGYEEEYYHSPPLPQTKIRAWNIGKGIVILLTILSILWMSGALDAYYYRIHIGLLEDKEKFHMDELKYTSAELKCFKNQLKRIGENKEVIIGYCKK